MDSFLPATALYTLSVSARLLGHGKGCPPQGDARRPNAITEWKVRTDSTASTPNQVASHRMAVPIRDIASAQKLTKHGKAAACCHSQRILAVVNQQDRLVAAASGQLPPKTTGTRTPKPTKALTRSQLCSILGMWQHVRPPRSNPGGNSRALGALPKNKTSVRPCT